MPESRVTVVPQKPIRYNYSTPSMSRRGGVRLHPIADGTANLSASQERIKTRDYMGHKFREHINPETGFCVGVSSVALSAPVNHVGRKLTGIDNVSGSPTGALRYLPERVIERQIDTLDSPTVKDYATKDEHTDRWVRMRTTADGDAPLSALPPMPRPEQRAPGTKRSGARQATGTKRPTGRPGATTPSGNPSRSDVLAFMKALCNAKGVPMPSRVTQQMYSDAKAVLLARMKQAQKVLAKG